MRKLVNGRPTITEVRSASGTLYPKTEYTWANVQPNSGVYIPYVQLQKGYTCDGDATCRITQSATTIDNYGNPTGIYNYGECPGGNCNNLNGDESATLISYVLDQNKNIFGVPKEVINSGFILSGGNYVLTTPYLKRQWLYYDNLPLGQVDKGNITQIEQWNSGGINPVTTISYDSYGNPVTITDPRGNSAH